MPDTHKTPWYRKEWLWLALLLVVEFILFDQVGAKHATRDLPRWNDQVQYLSEVYTRDLLAREQGLWTALRQSWVMPTAQGTLHDVWTTLVFAVTGPSRSAALSLNMLFFLGWQALCFVAIRRAFGSVHLAWAGAALLLCLRTLGVYEPGAPYDFRLDWMAAAWMGMACCAAYATDHFRKLKASLLFGACVGFCFGTRFITGTFFVLIYPALMLWISLWRRDAKALRNLVLSGLVTFIFVGPLFWINRESMLDYYYYGHYVGPESAIRNQNMHLWHGLSWIVVNTYDRHLGLPMLVVVAGGCLAFLALRFTAGKEARGTRPSLVPGILFTLCPLTVLLLHPQKSEVVLSVLIPGVIMLVIHLWAFLGATRERAEVERVTWALVAVSLGLFVAAMYHDPVHPEYRKDAGAVRSICARIFDNAHAGRLGRAPRIAVDYVSDTIDAQTLRVVNFEKTKKWEETEMTLPSGIETMPEPEVMKRLGNSDFVLLTIKADRPPLYPFDGQMESQREQHRHWCETHLRKIGDYRIHGRSVSLYQRHEIPDTAEK